MHLAATPGGYTVAAYGLIYGLIRMGDKSLAYVTRRLDRVDMQTKPIQEDGSVLAGHTAATRGPNYKYAYFY